MFIFSTLPSFIWAEVEIWDEYIYIQNHHRMMHRFPLFLHRIVEVKNAGFHAFHFLSISFLFFSSVSISVRSHDTHTHTHALVWRLCVMLDECCFTFQTTFLFGFYWIASNALVDIMIISNMLTNTIIILCLICIWTANDQQNGENFFFFSTEKSGKRSKFEWSDHQPNVKVKLAKGKRKRETGRVRVSGKYKLITNPRSFIKFMSWQESQRVI